MYSEAEGGEYEVLGDFSAQDFKDLKENGFFNFKYADTVTKIYPAYAMLVNPLMGHDFILEKMKKENYD